MEAAQQQEQQQYHSWKLNVRAKAKNLNFKLVASNFLPNCKYFPFSLSLKYCRFFIHLKSQTHTSPNRKKPKIFKSKLPRFLQRLRTRQRSKNNRVISSKPKNLKNIPPVSFLDKKITGTAMFLVSVYLFRALILYAVAETSVCKCKGLLILKYLVEVGKYWVDYMKLGVENIQGPASAFPRILGHEAAGVVESVEENVEEVKEGDIVIPVFQRNCGECRDCKYPKGNICSKFPEDFYCGMPSDGSSRFKDKNGEKLHHTLPMSPDFPVDEAYLLSRGVSTGLGAAWKVAEVEEGSTVAIFGLGAVGLAVTRVFLTPR
ncbi:Alcohol dehydrogenase-like 7 [Capsicum annuum]|nr:Alcohol dehydrogenase-like 7 [Capsicum annuum]